jgi:2',3'-cyclic-nucleotide 2'-phosphodiesterase (5'-nucleotidase family)
VPAVADPRKDKAFRLTVLGTADTHGNVSNWDYCAGGVQPAGRDPAVEPLQFIPG